MRRIFIIIVLLYSATVLYGQVSFVTEIKPARNERWWGLWVGGDPRQPFISEFSADTGDRGSDFFMASMMISDNGRYIWSQYPMQVGFDGTVFRISSEHEKVEARRGGNSLREAYLVCYHNNIRTGAEIPATDLFTRPVYDISMEEAVAPVPEKLIGYADAINAAGLPAGTLLLPAGWESRSRGLDFNFDIYPDPAETVRILHDKGFKVMLTLSPYVSAAGLNYVEASREGKLLTGPEGEPACFSDRSGYYACLDFTSPQVASDFARATAGLKEKYGVDGFLLECREAAVILERQEERLLRFLQNWNTVGEGIEMKICSPSYGTYSSVNGIGRDGRLTWESLEQVVNDAVISGMSGYIYPYAFPGYIDGTTDEELLVRTIQLSLTMPVAVLPPSAWNMKNSAYRDQVKSAVRMRTAISDYMAELLRDSEKTAEPIARHMAYQFNNQGFWNCGDQFALGSRYLIAPVLDASGKRTVRLPRGSWLTPDGRTVRGPRVVDADVSDWGSLVFTLQGR